MRKRRQQLAVLSCLTVGLLQMPQANAQAVEALMGLGYQLAPMVIPVALTAGVMAIQAIPRVPAMVKRCVPPMPSLRRKHSSADASEASAEPPASETEEEQIAARNVESENMTPAKEEEPVAAPSPAPVQQVRHVKRDASEWYMEEDESPNRPLPVSVNTTRSVAARPDLPAKTDLPAKIDVSKNVETKQATAEVKAERLLTPLAVPLAVESAESEATPVLSPKACEPQKNTPSEPPPIIMMKVSE